MIDKDGFRHNVGIVLANAQGQVLLGRRIGTSAWQFPQGGIKENEQLKEAMYRELNEEIGLLPEHVEIIANTKDWLHYWLPKYAIRYKSSPLCIGQKQIWYLLRLLVDDKYININHEDLPEFDHWDWVDFWAPIKKVVDFKQKVYQQALTEFAPFQF